MSASAISALKEKSEKLKALAERLKTEIGELQEDLSQKSLTVSRGDIELSLINDAFRMRFGDVSEADRGKILQGMANIQEIEVLEAELAKEKAQTKWCESEVQRLTALVPTKSIEDVNIEELKESQKTITEQLQSLKIRNQKRDKTIRLAENKISAAASEIRDLQDKLQKKEEMNERNRELQKQVSEITKEASKLATHFKEENAKMREVQDRLKSVNKGIVDAAKYVEDNEDTIRSNMNVQNELLSLFSQLDKCNDPMRDLKTQHDDFMRESGDLRKSMISHLQEINNMIEKLSKNYNV